MKGGNGESAQKNCQSHIYESFYCIPVRNVFMIRISYIMFAFFFFYYITFFSKWKLFVCCRWVLQDYIMWLVISLYFFRKLFDFFQFYIEQYFVQHKIEYKFWTYIWVTLQCCTLFICISFYSTYLLIFLQGGEITSQLKFSPKISQIKRKVRRKFEHKIYVFSDVKFHLNMTML